VSLSAEDRPPPPRRPGGVHTHARDPEPVLTLDEVDLEDETEDDFDQEFEHEDEHNWLVGSTAKYLLAGGVAGAGKHRSGALS
jgi:hypothetical protein